jgi:hypothetical protein
VNSIADRWERAAKKYKCGKRVVQISKSYSSEGFVGCNDPLESVMFSIGVLNKFSAGKSGYKNQGLGVNGARVSKIGFRKNGTRAGATMKDPSK